MRSPSCKSSIVRAAFTISGRSPFNRASKMEKVVHRTFFGVSATMRSTTCESQITRSGGADSLARAARYSVSFATTAMALPSSAARTACACGKINRPLGASMSTGMISSATPPGGTAPPSRSGVCSVPSGMSCPNAALKAFTTRSRCPGAAADSITKGEIAFKRSKNAADGFCTSVLPTTTNRGRPAAFISRNSRSSCSVQTSGSVISTATSTRRSAASIFSRRFAPSAESSSTPPVSVKTTGPMGSNSIVFSTGSVVVPACGDVMATSWPATRLRNVDFPTLVRPKRPMWIRIDLGVLSITRVQICD